MLDYSDNRSGKPIKSQRKSLTAFEIAGIVVLSALAHFGLWWLYQQSPITRPASMTTRRSPPPIQVTLTTAEPEQKTPRIDIHAVMPSKKKPEPATKRKSESKPKPKPKPKPPPKPESKPQPPESRSRLEPGPKSSPNPASNAASTPSPDSNRIRPAVSDLQSLNNPPPHYPRRALRRREEGVVKLKILVEPDGTAGKITVVKSSGYSALDEAAVKTVKKWRFKPARRGATPIRGYALQSISFKLPG